MSKIINIKFFVLWKPRAQQLCQSRNTRVLAIWQRECRTVLNYTELMSYWYHLVLKTSRESHQWNHSVPQKQRADRIITPASNTGVHYVYYRAENQTTRHTILYDRDETSNWHHLTNNWQLNNLRSDSFITASWPSLIKGFFE